MEFKKTIVVCGHYGSGKTNLSINIALYLKNRGEDVMVVDMDVVNPYFRSSEYKGFLEQQGIKVIAPQSANTTLDIPALSAEVFSAFEFDGYVIFDLGGDDVGATAMGRFSNQINNREHEVLYVVNKSRNLIKTADEAVEILKEIEFRSHLKADYLVNNTHLSYTTNADDVLNSIDYANDIAKITGLPIKLTSMKKELLPELESKISNTFPVDIIVKPIWE